MGYLFLALALASGVTKGYCGKKGFRYVKPTTWLTQYWDV